MTPREYLTELANGGDFELVFFEPADVFDPAIVGLVTGYGQEPAVLYDREKVIEGLMTGGMDHEDAEEFFDFNTIGSYVGPATPRFMEPIMVTQ